MRNILLCLAALAGGALAQDGADQASRRDDILAALELPSAAQSLRDKGVDKAQVKEAVQAAKGRKLKAREARDLMKDTGAAVDEHGPVDNFGAFVKGKLDAGLRGKDLAAAIREEHVVRGKGKGHGKKGATGPDDKEHGQPSKDKGKDKGKEKDKGGSGGGEEEEDDGGGHGKPEKESGGGGKGQGGGKGKGKGK